MDYITENMDVITSVGLLTVISVLMGCLVKLTSPRGRGMRLPPGPSGFPFVGYLPFLLPDINIQEVSMKLAKRYGDVFLLQLGSYPYVIVNGREKIREAFMNKIEAFAGRPDTYSSKILCNGKSVFLSSHYNEAWKLQRKICKTALHRFANIKSGLVYEIITHEANELVKKLLENEGKPFDPCESVLQSIGCVVYQICYGQTMNIKDDERFKGRLQREKEIFEFLGPPNPIEVMPWTQYLLPWKVKRYNFVVQENCRTRMEMIKNHSETFDPENLRDFTDGLLLAATQYSDEEKKAVGITNEHIFSNLEGVEGGGFETVTYILSWGILYMAEFSDVQERVRKEINDIVGGRLPQISDRSQLPYTEATILETLRMSSIAPVVSHCTTKDTTLNGYDIPKGTRVLANLYSVAFDEDYWGDPKSFRPDRFLAKNGEIDLEKASYVLPFSAGRRRCLGEKFARVEIFLMFVTILQKLLIIKPQGEKLYLKGIQTALVSPRPYKVIFREIS